MTTPTSPFVETRLQQFLTNNASFAASWHNPWQMADRKANAAKEGGTGILIVTCLDPRCVPEQFLGPGLGAGVIRNPGGRVTRDVVANITALRALLDVQGVLVIHHTDCGLTLMTDESIRESAEKRTPDAKEEIDGFETWKCFTAEEYGQVLKEDVRALREAKVLRGLDIRGLSLDLDTGLVTVVEVGD